VLGLAGAGVIVMAIASLTVLFDKDERPKAVGVWAAANFLALPLGPILGGWLLTHYWWGWVFLLNVPVAVVGVLAVAALVPETRAAERPGVDPIGVATSAAGLVAVVYGLIMAGQNGWSSLSALGFMLVGVVLLVGFYRWERWLTRRPGGQPLLDLSLFGAASFTWGVILAAVAVLAMIGVLFTMPQYFQGVLGTDAMGSGLRLLPLIGGLVVGAVPADGVVHLLGSKVATAVGFVLLAGGLFLGATTSVSSGEAFVAVWMGIVGAGMGLALATASSAALAELTEERSGVASAVLQAVNKVGGPFGTAILGSVLTAGYLTHLHLSALSASAASMVRQSIFGGVAVADQTRSASLLRSVRIAFTHGMDQALVVSAGIAVVGVVLTLLFLPQATATTTIEHAGEPTDPNTGSGQRKGDNALIG
jgi:DHA2 family multidrug resistance protein-like MFS transporter